MGRVSGLRRLYGLLRLGDVKHGVEEVTEAQGPRAEIYESLRGCWYFS